MNDVSGVITGVHSAARPIRLLTLTTLFPNNEQPNHGIFVENRLRQMVATGRAESVVVAPVPYFPLPGTTFGRWARYARVSREEERNGLVVYHPRFPVIPRIGMSVSPLLLTAALAPFIRRLQAQGVDFDVIDAHYLYPDGVAASWIGKRLNLPVVVTARGSDVNLIPQYRLPRRMIQSALQDTAGIIAVSQALKEKLIALGALPERIAVLRNGVDLSIFKPLDRAIARCKLGLSRPTLLSVGNLLESKGHGRVIQSLLDLTEFDLVIVGEGPHHAQFELLASRLGVSSRVRFLGSRRHRELPAIYNAADILVLASSREGWPNVLLEALACGTPVLASDVGGVREIIQGPEAGLIIHPNTSDSIAEAVRTLYRSTLSRASVRAYAERFSWSEIAEQQLALYKRIADPSRVHLDMG